MEKEKNRILFEKAKQYMPGGACAGGRPNQIFSMPLYVDRAHGSKLYSVDGEEYIDYHCGAGAALFGHGHPRLHQAIREALEDGFFMNHDSSYTLEFAQLFTKLVPAVEKIRFTNSGSEATQAAIRLARGYTGKKIIIKMDGHFHGMHESIWYNHSYFPEIDQYGEVTGVSPDSAGIPKDLGSLIKVVRFNDIEALEHAVQKYDGQVAAVIMEPISFNCGCYEAEREYLQQVRRLCSGQGILLILDEIITGLRFRPGSAQAYYGVEADISTFAKAISGGLPLALVGGKAAVMDAFNPIGPVVCSGTCSGTQIAVRAGVECLKMVLEPGFYETIEQRGTRLYREMNGLFQKHGVPGYVRGQGARFGIYFGCQDPDDDKDLRKTMEHFSVKLNRRFVEECLARGLYFHYYGDAAYPPHCGFGIQHSTEDIEVTLERMDLVFSQLGKI